jgi:hypothetical protein
MYKDIIRYIMVYWDARDSARPRTRSGLLGLTAAVFSESSDSAQSESMTQQLQSHLPHCLQACLATQQ